MSTSSFPNQGSPRTRVVGLREFLSEAVFVGAEDIEVRRCVDRADKCQPGDVFVPRHTSARDEHDHAELAIRRGAVAVVAERILPVSVPQCLVENTQVVYGRLRQALAGNPSQRMLTIGVVGSYGKSTTALFVAAMIKRLGGAVAYYTSLGASDSTNCDRTATRAPAAGKLAAWMERADLAGSPAVIVELTPAMLRNQVTAGVEFDLVILTGMRGGQLQASPSTREFTALLERLLGDLKPHGMVLYNADDANTAAWAAKTGCATLSYGLDAAEHVRGKRLSRDGGGQQLLAMAGNMLMPLTLKMPGDHMARAALAALAASWLFDFSVPEAIAGIESLEFIPGRMQRIHPGRGGTALYRQRGNAGSAGRGPACPASASPGPCHSRAGHQCSRCLQFSAAIGRAAEQVRRACRAERCGPLSRGSSALGHGYPGRLSSSRSRPYHSRSCRRDSLGRRTYRPRLHVAQRLWRFRLGRSRGM